MAYKYERAGKLGRFADVLDKTGYLEPSKAHASLTWLRTQLNGLTRQFGNTGLQSMTFKEYPATRERTLTVCQFLRFPNCLPLQRCH
jgi:hypothetical protein